MKRWATLFACLLLAACAATPSGAPPSAQLFADSSFSPPSEPVGDAALFDLSPAMRLFLDSPEFKAQLKAMGPAQGLVDALYKKTSLALEYDAAMTRNAAQAFDARSGNCLSLVIMTAAFARELGMKVRYQNVLAGETWSRNGDIYLASTHVNLSLAKGADRLPGSGSGRMLTVDFLPPDDMTGYRTLPLEEDDIRAMYLNNRAAEALVRDRIDEAYWWASAAVRRRPAYVSAYNTLGVVYQRRGAPLQAERVFRAALQRDPDNLVVLQNLVPVLAAAGKSGESAALARRVAALEPYPPYHFFKQGMTAMRAGDYQAARALFTREVRRAPYNDEFHFWLGIVALRLGDIVQAREQVAQALDTSTTGAARDRYSAKLAQLRSQR